MELSHHSNEREGGKLSIVTTTVSVSIGDPWEVQYARFFKFPSRPASPIAGARHPSLVPLAQKSKGSWISSFTSSASLKLLTTTNGHSIILTVTLVDKVIEEHYISKLHFTWPQVSCMTGYSPRGSKVVFMSYKDQAGKARHSNLLVLPTQDWDLLTTSTEFSEPMYRPIQDFSQKTASADTYYQPFYPVENHDGSINSSHLSQDVLGKLSAFPPSFTSLLMNCSPVTELALRPSDPEEVTLKKDIMKYLEDSSFQEMLSKVQKVVNEFGDDLLV
ncbi:hypothetical protein M8C21_031203 [Ambrosia artemisiifolia]|uniref:Poor homologous synapsis 1 PH domain-containing protein n=1 Tax=Ambrosia artemisiifolia TaxID=4212 RepID=A0AAD5BM25_AMBAR|nr:hypothetical protein M8C21_031203 [Ambrosia artemisiifolia]